MTEEEKLAKEYADKRIGKVLENSTFPNSYWHRQDWENCKQDFLAGYKAKTDEINKIGLALQSDMDKTIEQNIKLKAQIEKMKCCSNCKNCKRKFIKKNVFENTCKVEHCRNYDKWEIKEK